MDLSQWEWTCACCGKRHRGVPDCGFSGPLAHHLAATDPDITVIGKSEDDCVLEIGGQRHFFIRGLLEIPVRGMDGRLGFGAWTTLGAANHRRYAETFADDDQSKLGPMQGFLANALPGWEGTMDLRLDIWPQDGRQRPRLVVRGDNGGHPLHRDQAEGIDPARLPGIVALFLPCDGSA